MKKLLLLPFVALLLAATYGPPFSVSDFSSLTNRPNPSAINPVGVVLGRTSAYDGAGGLFVFNPAATNAIDDDIYLGTTTTGRWVRISRLVLLADNPLTLTNGQLSSALLTNYFSFLAGTNMQVTVTSNTVTYAMTNTATGSGGTNWYAYVVNTSQLIEKFGLIGNDSSDSYGELRWNVAATTNLLGGTNIFASIVDHKITNIKLDYTPTNSLLGSDLSTAAGSFANVGPIYVGANLLLSESGGVNTLSAIVSSGTNSWQIGVDGVVVTTPNLADASNVSVTASGTNVTFNLTATGVSAGTYSNVVITLDDRGRVTSASSGNLFTTLTNILTAGTNIVLTYGAGAIGINSYATGGGGGGDVYTSSNNVFTGTNTFTEQVIFDDLLVTNLTAENLILPFADGLVGSDSSSNAFKVTIGANLTYSAGTLSATGGGGATNGTAVTVDGGADLTRANFADSSLVTFTQIGTNITASIPDDSIALGTKTTGNFVAGVSGTANEVTVTGGSGSEASTGTISLPATIDLGGKTSFELPNAAAPTTDAFGEIAGDDNAWASGRGALQFFDGTANTWLVGVLSSDTPSNGQVPTWNTGGTITWETPSAGGGGTSTNILVNGTLVQNANLVDSSTVLWNVSGTNISATVTNVAGSTTSNVLQWVGSAYFVITNNSTIGDFSTFSTNGIINGLTCLDCQNDSPGIIQFDFPSRSTNYIWTFMPEGNVNGFVAYEAEGYRTATSLRVKIHEAAGSVFFTGGYWMRFDFWDKVAVGGSGSGGGGDVYTSSNNVFTANNTFQGNVTLGGYSRSQWNQRPQEFFIYTDGTYGSASPSYFTPWYGGAISSGTVSGPSSLGDYNHPIWYRLISAAGANSGYYYQLSGTATMAFSASGGGEYTDIIFRPQGTNDTRIRLGYQDGVTASDPTDGVYLYLFNNQLSGVCISNTASKATASAYTIASNAWYRGRIDIAANSTMARFKLYNESGTLLWSDETNNVPIGSNREFSHAVVAIRTNTTALNLIDIDYMALGNTNLLTR